MYPTVGELIKLWNDSGIEKEVQDILGPDYLKLPDVKKLMTAQSVIDLSAHEIYPYAACIHELTDVLINLRKLHPEDKNIEACCSHWLDILRLRNKIPLKLKHHQRIDGECDFRFSLQLMEGKPSGFKEIQVLDHQNEEGLDVAVKSMHRLGILAHGLSFAGLPMMKDAILTALMKFEDTICLIAKDQSDQIIGYSWGLMLRDVAINKKEKANVFWIMDLARDPDFFDDHTKVGEQIRARFVEELKLKQDCDFVGYQHILNHKFHMNIVSTAQNEDEQLHLDNAEHAARTTVKFSDDTGLFMRIHFIRANENSYEYPDIDQMKPAIAKAFWRASHSVKDFIGGAIAFLGVQQYKKMTNKLLDKPVDQRIVAPVPVEQQACDFDTLKKIIMNDQWATQGVGLFKHTPDTIDKLQLLVGNGESDFQAYKTCVASRRTGVTRRRQTAALYRAISTADSPTFVLNSLIKNKNTPQAWIQLITESRRLVLNVNHERNVAHNNMM